MDKDALRILLARGDSLALIGRRYGKHPTSVAYWVRKHGLVAAHRDRHAARGGVARPVLEGFVSEGLSMRAMARELGLSLATVRHWMDRYELTATAYVRTSDPSAVKPAKVERTCRTHGRTTFVLRRTGYRCPRCDSDRVTRRRRKVKQILIGEAGGACALCGYDRCPAALQFHHLDPATKSFNLSRHGVTKALVELRAEARKCVLLCANCHSEVEAGAATLSES